MGRRGERGCRYMIDKKKDIETWPLRYERIRIYVTAKKKLDKQLVKVPGGNKKLIIKLYKMFDKLIDDEVKGFLK